MFFQARIEFFRTSELILRILCENTALFVNYVSFTDKHGSELLQEETIGLFCYLLTQAGRGNRVCPNQ